MPQLLKFLLSLLFIGLVISALFIFGLFVLATLAILVPVSYLYLRFKKPHIFEQMRAQAKARDAYQNGHPDHQRQQPRDQDILEGKYERLDD